MPDDGKKLVYCVNVHVTAETEDVLKERAVEAAEILDRWVKSGELPVAQPEGIQIWPNHGTGGGP